MKIIEIVVVVVVVVVFAVVVEIVVVEGQRAGQTALVVDRTVVA